MKKTNKAVLALSAFMFLSFVGCTPFDLGDSASVGAIEVWGAYSSAKVMQDPDLNVNHHKLAPEINIKMAKGEKESGQIIITTDKAIDYYEMIATDLVNADGDKISVDNISVYHQWYSKTYMKSRASYNNEAYYPLGYTPDALIPQNSSIEFEENNIGAKANQGITVEVTTDSTTKPGVYTGTFTLKADGYVKKIPVKLQVWDYDISYTNGFNLWDLVDGFTEFGELDWYVDIETVYYEALLDNKLNAYHLPNDETPDGMVQSLLKYWDHPAFNGFFLPDHKGNINFLKSYLLPLIEVADENNINYFTAVAMYHASVDECWNSTQAQEDLLRFAQDTNKACEELAQMVLEGDYFSDDLELKAEVADTIAHLPQAATCYYDLWEPLQGVVNAFCYMIDGYETTLDRQNYAYNAEITGGQQWTYTCLSPYYPYPSYHIDDFSLGGRLLGWMKKSYGIEGYLNWSVNMFTKNTSAGWGSSNVYEDPLRLYNMNDGVSYANGDGFLFYPGKKYNLSTPVTSIRLAACRDGQEDYDTLCLLETLYETLAKEYGLDVSTISTDEIISTIYDSLFYNTKYYTDESLIEAARDVISDMILAAQSDSKVLFTSRKLNDSTAKVEIYSAADKISINGKALTKRNNKFSTVVGLEKGGNELKVCVEKDGKKTEYTYVIEGAVETVFDGADVKEENVTLSKGSNYNAEKNTFTIVSMGQTMEDKLIFVPYVNAGFGKTIDATNVQTFTISLTNHGDTDATISVLLLSNKSSHRIDKVMVRAGETVKFDVTGISKLSWSKLNAVTGLRLEFANTDSSYNLLPNREISINSIECFSLKED